MMPKHAAVVATAILLAINAAAHAGPPDPLPSTGTLIILPAVGEVRRVNDQVTVTLRAEETHKDKALAASRVNQKMKQGVAIVKNADPRARLQTESYSTYAVYPEPTTAPSPLARVPIGWRVEQILHVTTTDLVALPKTVAAAQAVLALSRLDFGLTPASISELDDERIVATYVNLNQRVRALARAMGRPVSDAVVELVDFDGAGDNTQHSVANSTVNRPAPPASSARDGMVQEPSFEPGETTLTMEAVGKVRFK